MQIESPVHVDEAARRVLDAYGVTRLGNRIREHLGWAIQHAERRGWLRKKGDFLFDLDQTDVPVRDRSNIDNRSRKLELIAPAEIRAAIDLVVRHAHGIPAEEVPNETCTLLGFSRTTSDMASQVHPQIKGLLQRGRIVLQNGLLLPGDETVPLTGRL